MTFFLDIFKINPDNLSFIWAFFAILVLIVIFTAVVIPRFAMVFFRDFKIFNKNIFNQAVINILFLSLITSLPEIISISFFPYVSETTQGGYLKSFANVLGSNLFSGLFFTFFSFLFARMFFFKKIEIKTRLATFFVLTLNFLFLFAIIFPSFWKFFYFYKNISLINVVLIFLYALFIIYLFKKYRSSSENSDQKIDFFYKRQNSFVFIYFFIFIIILLIALFLLMFVCENIKTYYQLSEQSVGGVLFAIVTTSPEIWSAFGLLRLGFPLSAFGIVVGSHLFNLIFFLAADLLYHGEITKNIFDNHPQSFIYSLFFAFLIMLFFIFWQKKFFNHQKRYYFFFPFLIVLTSFLNLSYFVIK